MATQHKQNPLFHTRPETLNTTWNSNMNRPASTPMYPMTATVLRELDWTHKEPTHILTGCPIKIAPIQMDDSSFSMTQPEAHSFSQNPVMDTDEESLVDAPTMASSQRRRNECAPSPVPLLDLPTPVTGTFGRRGAVFLPERKKQSSTRRADNYVVEEHGFVPSVRRTQSKKSKAQESKWLCCSAK